MTIKNILSKEAQYQIELKKINLAALLNNYYDMDFLTATDKKKVSAFVDTLQEYKAEYITLGTVSSSQKTGAYLIEKLAHKKQEELWVLTLDTKNQVTHEEMVHKGTLNTTISHPRDIFRTAIKKNACRIVLAHNHPSGDVRPSQADLGFTEKIKKAGELIGIELLDHFITGHDTYLSFREEVLL